MTYIEVSVSAPFAGRSYYTYKSAHDVTIGTIVQVPFGKKNLLGIVRCIVKKPTFSTKEILQITPLVLSSATLHLLTWLEQFYPYDYGDLSSLFIPPNALTNSRQNSMKATVNNVAKPLPPLTDDQTIALSTIQHHQHIMLHGNTGTGKTRVFLEYANHVLNQGKSVLVLTPEIGLTPQLEQDIIATCPYPVHIIHSLKTPAHRKRVWLTAAEHREPALFIGPRSSLFLPYKSLGLVVVDEAHDNSYKNMQSPKYSGLYVAAQLAKLHHAHMVQSSATPNVSDYNFIQSKAVPVARMTTIAAGKALAEGMVIDLNDKTYFTRHRLISDALIEATATALQKGEQTMLFINRRGSARVVQCGSCGHIAMCDVCGLPLTFHHDMHLLSCHVCGKSQKATSQCSSCSSTDLVYYSPGTKGLEQEITQLFSQARIARFDLDVPAKDTIHRKLSELQAGNFDIIIGTQLISKGFDLPRLSVVGVLNADTGFSIPDYRAEEVTFQQLYQVTGRVGRGHKLSKFFIQSRQPSHPVIKAALERNWQQFYDYELAKRKLFSYPPFTHLALLSLTKAKQQTAKNGALKLHDELTKLPSTHVLGPTPSYYETAHGGYTWQLLIKSPSRKAIMAALLRVPGDWIIDIDPTSVL